MRRQPIIFLFLFFLVQAISAVPIELFKPEDLPAACQTPDVLIIDPTLNPVPVSTEDNALLFSLPIDSSVSSTFDPEMLGFTASGTSAQRDAFLWRSLGPATNFQIFLWRLDMFWFGADDIPCAATYWQQFTPTRSDPPATKGTSCSGPCCFQSSSGGMSEWTQCLQTIPIDDTRKALTIDTVRKNLQVYIYQDINRDSGPPANIEVDLWAGLAEIEATTHSYEYELHRDIQILFTSSKDPHLNYQSCLSQKFPQIRFPFVFKSTSTQNEVQTILLSTQSLAIPSDFVALFGFSPQDYDGWEVVSIQDQNALEFLVNEANLLSNHKDEAARFNHALLGIFTNRNSDRQIPVTPTWRLVLRKPNTLLTIELEAPWFASPDDRNPDQIVLECSLGTQTKRDDSIPFAYRIQQSDEYSLREFESVYLMTLSSLGNHPSIGVLGIPTFEPSITLPDESILYYWQTVHAVFHRLALFKYRFTRIIIDISNNPGGVYQNSYFTSEYWGNLQSTEVTRVDFNIIHSPLTTDLVNWYSSLNSTQATKARTLPASTLYSPKMLSGSSDLSVESWYRPGENLRLGGHTSTYSSKFETVDLAYQLIQPKLDQLRDSPFYIPYTDNLIIVSNGLCVSACSFFVEGMKTQSWMKVIVYGGLIGKPLASNVAPAEVLETNTLAEYRESVNNNPLFENNQIPEENLPVVVPWIATLSITIRATYTPNEEIPLEFLPTPGQYRLNIWALTANDRIYSLVAQFFDCCFEGDPCNNPCPLDSSSQNFHLSFFVFISCIIIFLLLNLHN